MDQLDPDERLLGARADDEYGDDIAVDDDSDAPVRLDTNGHLPAAMDAADAAGDIRAERVTISQGGARDIQASTVSITQGGAAQVRAQEMSLSESGVALARAQSLAVNDGGSAFAVLADKATVEDGGNVFLLVAGEVSGDARPILDWRAALGLGAGLVLAWRILRRIF